MDLLALASTGRMGCLDEATLDDFVCGKLSGETLVAVESHIDRCATCSDVVAVLAGGSAERRASELASGATIGRHVVIEPLGRGAMGIVYLASDPELDRKVAVKLVEPSVASLGAEKRMQRMVREAQAMAKLSHPNVVAVYDVGRHQDGVYIAMEYVPGPTLREWLDREPRAYRAVLDAFLAAGAGLAHAHAQGLVHRDFKPDNVIVGNDGRVRVTDFGLARLPDTLDEAGTTPNPNALELTRTGTLLGTPAYMAPEQLAGGDATRESDQFAFSVALYEALFGVRPFAGRTIEELRDAIGRGALERPIRGTDVPAAIRDAVRRGLRENPAERFGSLEALLGELSSAVRPRSRALWPIVAVAVAIAGGGLIFMKRAAAGPCAGGAAVADPIWNDARRTRVASALGADGTRVTGALDAFAVSWKRAHRATCEATHVRREQSETLLDARMRCLNGRLDGFDTLVGLFERGDRDVTTRAREAVDALPAISDCADVASLGTMEPRPTDPAVVARLSKVEQSIERARAEGSAGRIASALGSARALAREASEIGYKPVLAEAKLLVATLARQSGAYDEADREAHAALFAAEAARADRIAAKSWLEVIATLGERGRHSEIDSAGQHAAAAIARLGEPPELRASLLAALGSAHTALGKLDVAGRELDEALALRKKVFGEESLRVARTLTALGNLARVRGDLPAALELHQNALGLDTEILGANHPSSARHHHNIAGVLRLQGHQARAIASYRRALELERTGLGEKHPSVGLTENSIAIVEIERGNLKEARAGLGRALAILELVKHPDRALSFVNLGLVDAGENQHADAIANFDKAISIYRESLGADHLRIASALLNRSRSERARGDLAAEKRDRAEALHIAKLHAAESAEAKSLVTELETPSASTARAKPKVKPTAKAPRGGSAYGAAGSWDPE